MQAVLVVFTSQQISKPIVLATLGGWLEWQHFFCKLSLILTVSFIKIQGDVERGSAQQLCGILCVTFAKLAGSEKPLYLYLLFCNRLFVDYWATFPSCALFLQRALRTLFAFSNAGSPTMDHGLFIGGCFKVSLYCCSHCTERRNFEIFSVFLLQCGIKKLSGSHLALLSSSLLSEFQTLFG